MSKITGFLIFATGFLGGSISAYFALKKRFDILMEEEIQSVKESYEKFNSSDIEDPCEEHDDIVGQYIHDDDQNTPKEQEEPLQDVLSRLHKKFESPYCIPPNEFNEVYGYETATLTLYSDGVIADEDMEIVDDVDEILGEENLQQLRDGETDCVYIRNDSKYCDYEVLMDFGTFEDAVIGYNAEEEHE